MNKQQNNRQNFPQTARLVDEFRRAFGQDQVKVIWCEENGKTAGKLPDPQTKVQHAR